MEPYNQETEAVMRRFYGSLSEKDRRRYAGIEALKYGHGGRNYIAQVLGCSRRTVSKGAKEVSGLSRAETEKRIRRPGGGRKSYQESWIDIDEKFRELSRGSESSEQFVWLNRRYGETEMQLSRSAMTPSIRADLSQDEVS